MGVQTWLMKGFFDTIPTELDESARVDGATPAQIFWGVVLPLAAPVLAVVALISFVFTLNEFVIAIGAAADERPLHAAGRHAAASSASSTASAGGRSPPASLMAAIPVVAALPVPAAVDRQRPDRGRGQGMSVASASRGARHGCSIEPHHDGSDLLRRSSARTSSAARRSSALRVPRAARADRVAPPLRPRRRAAHASRRSSTRRRRPRRWWRATFPRREPGDALPLAALGRRAPATRG